MSNKQGKIVVVSGPSGVGKSTICKQVIEQVENAYLSVSLTTRPQSELEKNGKDYWFVSREDFKKQIDAGNLLEHAEVFGNLYGTDKGKTDEALKCGHTVILEIDVQGGRQIKRIYPDAIMIFILPPTHDELAVRLNGRGREEIKATERRLDGAGTEIAAAWQHYKHMIINDKLDQAVDEVVEIIK